MNTIHNGSAKRQSGVATLLVALVLLAILTVITIFAANYGLFEQRASGNDYRYKLAFQAAEAGLGQGMEYLKVNTSKLVSKTPGGWLPPATTARWQPCSSPLPAGMAYDPCTAEADPTRRSHLYRYVGSTNGVLPLSEVLPSGSQTFTATGGDANFSTTYNTYATLCRLDTSSSPPLCSTAPTNEGTFYVTIVSRGGLGDENATASVMSSFAAYHLLGQAPDAPLIAAGTSVGLGSAEIVPNPDAGGFGVPVSIWAKGNADIAAADFMSCQLGEWLTSATPEDEVNGVCSACHCTSLRRGYGFLSGKTKDPGGSVIRVEGLDILDVEPASGGDINIDGATDSHYFPPDLFAYVFGIPSSGATAYLTANAKPITDCSTELTAASSGLYWYTGTGDCTIANSGSLSAPVVLVSDQPVKLNANATFYGIIFVRDDLIPAGTDLLKASGTPQVYGSVILEGSAKINGSPGIIYNKAVLQNIFNSSQFTRYGPVPGSWSDTVN